MATFVLGVLSEASASLDAQRAMRVSQSPDLRVWQVDPSFGLHFKGTRVCLVDRAYHKGGQLVPFHQ